MHWRLTSFLFLFCFSLGTLHSQNRNGNYELARQQYYDGLYDLALRTITEYQNKRTSVDGFYLEYMIFDALGESMSAIRSLTSIVDLDPSHIDAVFKRGELYYRQGIYLQALKDFNHILTFDGETNTNAIYFRLDPHGQEQVTVATLTSMRGQVLGLRGLTYQAMGEHDRAIEDLNMAVSMDSSAQNLVNRALLFKEMNNVPRARDDLRWAVQINPQLVLAWYNLLIVDPNVQLPEHILTNSTFIPLITYQAVEALQNENLELASSLFSTALMANPNDPLLLVNAGRLSYKLKHFQDAITFHLRALELDPGYFEVYYLIGNAHFQLNEFTQSAANYEQYVARDRSDPTVWYNMALAYRELQNHERACESLANSISRGMTIEQGSSLLIDCNQ